MSITTDIDKAATFINAWQAGHDAAKAALVPGQKFKGAMIIATEMGHEIDSLEWQGAMSGAYAYIKTQTAITDADGIVMAE
jgi:hypothetical protein